MTDLTDLIDIPQPVREMPYGKPEYAGDAIRRTPLDGGQLHEDTETGGVCVLHRDSSFVTSFTVLRFESLEAFSIWEGSICQRDSDHYRADYSRAACMRLRIEREWVEVESFGRMKGRYQYYCICTETGDRLQYPNEVVHRYSKTDGYLPFRKG